MGVVVLQGKRLLRYGVHQLRNGARPHDVIGQAKRIVLGYVARHNPDIVAIEEPLDLEGLELEPLGRQVAVAGDQIDAVLAVDFVEQPRSFAAGRLS